MKTNNLGDYRLCCSFSVVKMKLFIEGCILECLNSTLAAGISRGSFSPHTVVIGLDMTAYTTDEGTAVNLVARVVEGVITQNTIVFLTTSDGTATSKNHGMQSVVL